ncbi:MAG: low molecular weight protein-tyrosine-phosphatase [Rhodospirillales bacterium]
MTVNVLFVCLGNICRSPTAEGVFRALVEREGYRGQIACDSAGTGAWHLGKPPDGRAQAAAARRGYDLSSLRARQAEPGDFARFDYVCAMDRSNLRNLQALAPRGYGGLGLMMAYAPELAVDEVPDPYYGEGDGFERVLDLLEAASGGLLAHIVAEKLSA